MCRRGRRARNARRSLLAWGPPDDILEVVPSIPPRRSPSLQTNPTPEQSAFDDAISTLRVRFAESVGATVASFRTAADQLERAPASPPVLASIRRDLHRLSGTAGTFGFPEAGRLAGAMDLVVERWAGSLTVDLTRRGSIVRSFASILGAALGPRGGAADAVLPNRLMLVDLDDELAMPIVAEALHRGRFVERIPSHLAQELIDTRAPAGVVSAADVLLTLAPGTAHVLLRAPMQQPAPHGPTATVLDRRAGVDRIFVALESAQAQGTLAGTTVLTALGDDAATLAAVQAAAGRHGMAVVGVPEGEDVAAIAVAHQVSALVVREGVVRDTLLRVRMLREDDRFGALPILLLTEDGSADFRERAFAAGVDDLQVLPLVPVEFGRRLSRLVELQKHRSMAREMHPVSNLPMRGRASRDLEEGLRVGAAVNQTVTLVAVRPDVPPRDREAMAGWQEDCRRIAAGLAGPDLRIGFLEDDTLGILYPGGVEETEDRLRPFAEAAAAGPVLWRAGLAEQRPGADVAFAQVLRAAEEAWLIAKDDAALLHRWSESDTGVAPDVVIVEDDPVLTDLMTYAVATRGLTSVTYATGPEALQGLLAMRTHRRQPIVLLDIDLPGLDGFSLFERLQVERAGVFRVAFVSIRTSEADQLRALRAGAIDFLAKPLSLRILFAKLAIWRAQGVPT